MSTALKKALEEKKLDEIEISISELIAKGLSNKEVANQLFKDEEEIKKSLKKIYKKINVANRAQLIVFCLPLLSFQQNFSHVQENITLKINHNHHELNQMENIFGGVFIDIDDKRREVHVVGSNNVDLKSIFKVDNISEEVSLENVESEIKEQLLMNNLTVLSKAEFRKNLGL